MSKWKNGSLIFLAMQLQLLFLNIYKTFLGIFTQVTSSHATLLDNFVG